MVILFVIIATFYFFRGETNSTDTNIEEIDSLVELVQKVHDSIEYCNGEKSALFTDEVLKIGEGHCGHISRMLFRELLKLGYTPEIVSIKTYHRNNHSMIQIKTKNGILLDKRSLSPINLYGDNYCDKLTFSFSKKFKIRDLYVYGK